MKLKVRSNGREVELSKALYDGLSEDQKRNYEIISKKDAEPAKVQTVKNEVKSEVPPTGDKPEEKKEDKK